MVCGSKRIADCSAEELREFAKQKEKEEKIAKIGYLKFDLYDFRVSNNHNLRIDHFWITECEKQKLIEEFKNNFEILANKGTKFVCYIDSDGENWYDDEGIGIEDMNSVWAEKYLENIKDV